MYIYITVITVKNDETNTKYKIAIIFGLVMCLWIVINPVLMIHTVAF